MKKQCKDSSSWARNGNALKWCTKLGSSTWNCIATTKFYKCSRRSLLYKYRAICSVHSVSSMCTFAWQGYTPWEGSMNKQFAPLLAVCKPASKRMSNLGRLSSSFSRWPSAWKKYAHSKSFWGCMRSSLPLHLSTSMLKYDIVCL